LAARVASGLTPDGRSAERLRRTIAFAFSFRLLSDERFGAARSRRPPAPRYAFATISMTGTCSAHATSNL